MKEFNDKNPHQKSSLNRTIDHSDLSLPTIRNRKTNNSSNNTVIIQSSSSNLNRPKFASITPTSNAQVKNTKGIKKGNDQQIQERDHPYQDHGFKNLEVNEHQTIDYENYDNILASSEALNEQQQSGQGEVMQQRNLFSSKRRSKSNLDTYKPKNQYNTLNHELQKQNLRGSLAIEKSKYSSEMPNILEESTRKQFKDQSQRNIQEGKQKLFFETFNPSEIANQNINKAVRPIYKHQQQSQRVQNDIQSQNDTSVILASSQRDSNQKAKKKYVKLINTDYVPGPGYYPIRGTFEKSERSINNIISRRRQASTNFQSYSQLSYHNQKTLQSNLTTITNNNNQHQTSTTTSNTQSNNAGKFGLSFEKVRNQYFKEFKVELLGKHSPGPGAYSPRDHQFELQKHDQKTLSKEPRECPLVAKQQKVIQLSPFSYNYKYSSFKINKATNFYGSKAERRVDPRICKFLQPI